MSRGVGDWDVRGVNMDMGPGVVWVDRVTLHAVQDVGAVTGWVELVTEGGLGGEDTAVNEQFLC